MTVPSSTVIVLWLLVAAPGEAPGAVRAEAAPHEQDVGLGPEEPLHEVVVVTAESARDRFEPTSITSTPIEPAALPRTPASLTHALSEVPGTSEHGQGGLLQGFSIRGLARHRVATMVSGVRITSERRAGASASFFDPLLMGRVDVQRGPASVLYGSGALGGAVLVTPANFDGLSVQLGYESAGGASYQQMGWGNAGWSVGIARRHAADSRAADGSPRFDRYDRLSGVAEKRWQSAARSSQLVIVPSWSSDIGKASTDYPARRTIYPSESHLLIRYSTESRNGWRASGFVHPHSLDTDISEPDGERRLVDHEALDLGGSWEHALQMRSFDLRLGIDYFGRRGVSAREQRFDSGAPQAPESADRARPTQHPLANGQEDELGAYGVLDRSWRAVRLELGTRLIGHRQKDYSRPLASETTTSSRVTGFAGLSLTPSPGLDLSARVGTGVRFPTLSERFFTGSTGRGQVSGNVSLRPESSLNLEIGARRSFSRTLLTASVFRQQIQDYIERVDLEPDLQTYRNLGAATIEGVELEGWTELTPAWSVSWNAHHLEGRSDRGRALADVPAHRIRVGGHFQRGRWSASTDLAWHAAREEVGDGEKRIPSAVLLAASASFGLGRGLELTASAANLLDELYYPTADRKSPLAPGRSVGLGIRWRRD